MTADVDRNPFDMQSERVTEIIDTVTRSLSGRDGLDVLDVEPIKRLCVGVLTPPRHDLDVAAAARRSRRLPDALGFDARVAPDEAVLQGYVDLQFALYYRVVPTHAEQAEWERDTRRRGRQPLRTKFRRADVAVNNIPFTVALNPASTIADGDVVQANQRLASAIADVAARIETDTQCWPTNGRITVENANVASAAAYDAAIPRGVPVLPRWLAELSVRAINTVDGWRLSVLVQNRSQDEGMHAEELYDVRFTLHLTHGRLISEPFAAAALDYRYSTMSWGRGINAVLQVDGEQTARAETLPIFRQPRLSQKTAGTATSTERLSGQDATAALDEIAQHLQAYADEWERDNANYVDTTRAQRDNDLERYRGEIARYRHGMAALQSDPRLMRAFQLANRAARRRGLGSWYLFQIVFIVILMPSLLARENADPQWRNELDIVDVLWFPTGGGKTEAYFGAILVALFYDRLRRKQRGTTAWLRYPLRMLSIQQLQRLTDFVAAAEEIRAQEIGNANDDPFEIGFYVGSGNTLNELTVGFFGATHPIDQEREKADRNGGDLPERKVLQRCPYCRSTNLRIEVLNDPSVLRMLHRCADCTRVAPIYVSDSEIYRYAPSVLVGTVDRLARAGQTELFRHLFSQFSQRCRQHGYMGPSGCIEATCRGRQNDAVDETYDPTPALLLQDELHLLKESLGTYDSHFEGFLDEFARSVGTRLPPKRIAATATIERYERHIRELYGSHLIPRRFPEKGRAIDESAYVQSDRNNPIARFYVGILPFGATTDEVAARIAEVFDTDAQQYAERPDSVPAIADLYELALVYVNMKNAAGNIGSVISNGRKVITLTGERTFQEVREAIQTIEEDPRRPRDERLKAIVATSIISHGVDLSRLNVMAFSGFPGHAADYIQSSSRVGRSALGVVFTVFNSADNLDRSTYVHFMEYHDRLYQLVQPVPINKFSHAAIRRTFTGIFSALLTNIIGLQDGRSYQRGNDALAAYAAQTVTDDRMFDILYRSYEMDALAHEPELQARYEELLRSRTRSAKHNIQTNQDYLTYRRLRPEVIPSLRDVQEQVPFSPKRTRIDEIERLRGA